MLSARNVRAFTLAALFLSLPGLGTAQADEMQKVMVRGIPVRVYGTEKQGFVVTAGDQIVIREETANVEIKGIYEGNQRTYIVVELFSGGASCCFTYRAVDLSSARYLTSPEFGIGGSRKVTVEDGALIVRQVSGDRTANEVYRFRDGKFDSGSTPINLDPSGPDEAPGGDAAAFANGMAISQIFKSGPTAKPLRALMGEAAFRDARSVALQDFGSPAAQTNGIVAAGACQPHDCGSHSVAVAFDHEGRAWARLTRDGKPVYFGGPDNIVRRILDR